MYEETINGLRTIVNNFKGRLTPWMRITIAEAADVIHRLSHQADDWEKIATYWREKYEELSRQLQEEET